GRLQMLLLDEMRARLGRQRVRVGHRLTTLSDHGRRVAATFVERRAGQTETEEADVMVEADGIHSAVRRQLYPDEGPPRFAGRLRGRGVTESLPFLTGRSMVMIGHARQKFVAYPICPAAAARGRALVNWVAELATDSGTAPPERDWNRQVDRAVFAPSFAG